MSALRTICRWTATLLTGVAVLAAFAAAGSIAAGYRPQPVLTGSMAPRMPVGSMAVAKPEPAAAVRVGDVITFQRPDNPQQTITHRVIAIHVHDGARTYETKGDANPAKDPWVLNLPGQVGRRVAVIPYAGYVAIYAGRAWVHAAAIGLMSLFLLVGVLRTIWGRDEDTAPAPAGAHG